jgi:hypothetical protein
MGGTRTRQNSNQVLMGRLGSESRTIDIERTRSDVSIDDSQYSDTPGIAIASL